MKASICTSIINDMESYNLTLGGLCHLYCKCIFFVVVGFLPLLCCKVKSIIYGRNIKIMNNITIMPRQLAGFTLGWHSAAAVKFCLFPRSGS